MFRILIVCSANRCRSPVAEAVLRYATRGYEVEVESAGTMERRAAPALPAAVEMLENSGIDISGHRSKGISTTRPGDADLVLGFEQFHIATAVAAGADPDKAFTLQEFVRLLEDLPPPRSSELSLEEIVAAAAAHRARDVTFVVGDEMADPAGGTEDEIRASTAEVARLSRVVAHHLFGVSLPKEKKRVAARGGRTSRIFRNGLASLVVACLIAIAIAAWIVVGRLPERSEDVLGPRNDRSQTRSTAFSEPRIVGELTHAGLDESSGLVASRISRGTYWTHEDSGNLPLIFCLKLDGESCGTWRVEGVRYAQDWEDIGASRADGSDPYLYIGDIGDNGERRPGIVIVRVAEPDVSGTEASTPGAATAPAELFRYKYPDGAHDAEALVVQPQTGDVYVITKSPARVYAARAPLDASRVGVLEAVADLDLPPVTGASITGDGKRVVLATYGTAFELTLRNEPFDQIWMKTPQVFEYGEHRQGEAIAYRIDGDAVVSTSEGEGAPIYQVQRKG